MKKPSKHVGTIINTKGSGDCIVLDIVGNDATVRFLQTGYTTTVNRRALSMQTIKDPYYPSRYGVGYHGEGKHLRSVQGVDTKDYLRWSSMLSRCYHEPFLIKNERYRGCTVSEEWKCFQTFANDIQTIPGYAEYKADPTGYQLDKDILVPGNRCYSKETCMFVPVSVNSLEGIARQNGRDTTQIRMNAIKAASRPIGQIYQEVMPNQFDTQ